MKLRAAPPERLSPLESVLQSAAQEANAKSKTYLDLHKPLPKNRSPGSLHLEWKRCGRPCCRCNEGLLHGPYVYRHCRHGPRQIKAYVVMRDLAQLIAELEEVNANLPRQSLMRKALTEEKP